MLPDITMIRDITSQFEHKREEENLKQQELFQSRVKTTSEEILLKVNENIIKCAELGKNVDTFSLCVDTDLNLAIYNAVYSELKKSSQYDITSTHIKGTSDYPLNVMKIQIKW